MDPINRAEIESLAKIQGIPCVSIYTAMHGTWPEIYGDYLRFQDRLHQARQALIAQGSNEAEAQRLLEPAFELAERSELWQPTRARTLAVFLNAHAQGDGPLRFWRLPFETADSVDVAGRFYVTPLLSLLDRNVPFLLLALNTAGLKLYECDRQRIAPIPLPAGLAPSLDIFLAGMELGRPLRFQTSAPATRGAGGDQVGPIHSQTSYRDDHQLRVTEYVQRIGKEFQNLLHYRREPLVIAGGERLQATFRQACHSPRLAEQGVIGSPQHMTEGELHAAAMEKVWAWRQQRLAQFNGRFGSRTVFGRACYRIETIIEAARSGRVDALVFGDRVRLWGDDDPVNRLVSIHREKLPGDVDLVNAASVETLLHGGDVHAVEPRAMPEGTKVAAVLRW